jgi:hypothetical protein
LLQDFWLSATLNAMKARSVIIVLSCLLIQPVARAADDGSPQNGVKDEITKPSGTDKGKPVADKTTEGRFLGIEEGDFSHWQMKTADGKDVSYFILKPDASVEKVLKNPEAFKGKKCRVHWRESMETLPDGGGKTMIEHVVSVEWLDRK